MQKILRLGGVEVSEVCLITGEPCGKKELKFSERVKITLDEVNQPANVHFFCEIRKQFSAKPESFAFFTLGDSAGKLFKNGEHTVPVYKYPSKGLEGASYMFAGSKVVAKHDQVLPVGFSTFTNSRTGDSGIIDVLKTKTNCTPNELTCESLDVKSGDCDCLAVSIIDALLFNIEHTNSSKVFDVFTDLAGTLLFSPNCTVRLDEFKTYLDTKFRYPALCVNFLNRVGDPCLQSLKRFKAMPLITRIIAKSYQQKLGECPSEEAKARLFATIDEKTFSAFTSGFVNQINSNGAVAAIAQRTFTDALLSVEGLMTPEHFVRLFTGLTDAKTKLLALVELAEQVEMTPRKAECLVPAFLDTFLEQPQLSSLSLISVCMNHYSREGAADALEQPLADKLLRCYEFLFPYFKGLFSQSVSLRLDQLEDDERLRTMIATKKSQLIAVFFMGLSLFSASHTFARTWSDFGDARTLKTYKMLLKMARRLIDADSVPAKWVAPKMFVLDSAILFVRELQSNFHLVEQQQQSLSDDETPQEGKRQCRDDLAKFFSALFQLLFSLPLSYLRKDRVLADAASEQCQADDVLRWYVDVSRDVFPLITFFWERVERKGAFAAPLSELCLKWFTILTGENQNEVFKNIIRFYLSIVREVFLEQGSLDAVLPYSVTGINTIGSTSRIKPLLVTLFFEKRIIPDAAGEGVAGFADAVKALVGKLLAAFSVMVTYMSIPEGDEYTEDRLCEGAKMMEHFRTIDKDNSLLYLYNIYQEHNRASPQNKLEAGLIFLEHAKMLPWSNEHVDIKVELFKGDHVCADLKKKLLLNAKNCMTDVCAYYQTVEINDMLLARFLKEDAYSITLNEINDKLSRVGSFKSGMSRTRSNYYLVKCSGPGFPAALKGKSFIYKTHSTVDVGTFRARLERKFADISPAFLPALGASAPADLNTVVLVAVFPAPQLFPSAMSWEFRAQHLNMNVSCFVNHPGGRSGDAYFRFQTSEAFPFILTRSEVTSCVKVADGTEGIALACRCWELVERLNADLEKGLRHKSHAELAPTLAAATELMGAIAAHSAASETEADELYCAVDSMCSVSQLMAKTMRSTELEAMSAQLRTAAGAFVSRLFPGKSPDESKRALDDYLTGFADSTGLDTTVRFVAAQLRLRLGQQWGRELEQLVTHFVQTKERGDSQKLAQRTAQVWCPELEAAALGLLQVAQTQLSSRAAQGSSQALAKLTAATRAPREKFRGARKSSYEPREKLDPSIAQGSSSRRKAAQKESGQLERFFTSRPDAGKLLVPSELSAALCGTPPAAVAATTNQVMLAAAAQTAQTPLPDAATPAVASAPCTPPDDQSTEELDFEPLDAVPTRSSSSSSTSQRDASSHKSRGKLSSKTPSGIARTAAASAGEVAGGEKGLCTAEKKRHGSRSASSFRASMPPNSLCGDLKSKSAKVSHRKSLSTEKRFSEQDISLLVAGKSENELKLEECTKAVDEQIQHLKNLISV